MRSASLMALAGVTCLVVGGISWAQDNRTCMTQGVPACGSPYCSDNTAEACYVNGQQIPYNYKAGGTLTGVHFGSCVSEYGATCGSTCSTVCDELTYLGINPDDPRYCLSATDPECIISTHISAECCR
jgi:hypothetical protein